MKQMILFTGLLFAFIFYTPIRIYGEPDSKNSSLSTNIAYLVDTRGTIVIKSGEKDFNVTGSCTALFNKDILILNDNASAKVIYPDKIVNVKGKTELQIEKQTIKIIKGSSDNESVKAFNSRGTGSGTGDAMLFIPPATIGKVVVASINRSDDKVLLISPQQQIYSLTPDIYSKIINKELKGKEFYVRILSLDDDSGIPPQKMSKGILLWADTEWKALEPDSVYRIEIKDSNNTILTGPEEFFATLPSSERKSIESKIADVKKLFTDKRARIFAIANILYLYKCYSETLVLAIQLNKEEPENPVYLKLLEHCCAILKVPLKKIRSLDTGI